MDFVKDAPEGCNIQVWAQPGARKNEILDVREGFLKIKIAAPPVDGSANQELIEFFADLLSLSKSKIQIVRGEAARKKVILVRGVSASEFKRKIESQASPKKG